MPNCYTCHQDITFDKNIRSPTGKQIPLWPDKKDAHGHDEEGKPIRQPILPQYQQQQQQTPKQQYEQRVSAATEQLAQSQGGSYLDTKRIRVMLEDLGKEIREFRDEMRAITQIDTPKLIGQLQSIFDLGVEVGKLPPTAETAAQLYQKQKSVDSTLINHAAKADKSQEDEAIKEFERMKQLTKDDEDENDTGRINPAED